MKSSAKSKPHIKSQHHFCLLLANQFLFKEAQKDSNFVASPSSLHVMLSLVAAGSKGPTLEQLLIFLRSTSVNDLILLTSQIIRVASPDEGSGNHLNFGPGFSFVNGAWLDHRFMLKPSFETIVNGSYRAQLKDVDFLNRVLCFVVS